MEKFYKVRATGQLRGMNVIASKEKLVSSPAKVTRRDFVDEFMKDFDDLWSIEIHFSWRFTLMNILCPSRLSRMIKEEK